jgi:hypothetical protein
MCYHARVYQGGHIGGLSSGCRMLTSAPAYLLVDGRTRSGHLWTGQTLANWAVATAT